jgi:hypothetical protein
MRIGSAPDVGDKRQREAGPGPGPRKKRLDFRVFVGWRFYAILDSEAPNVNVRPEAHL